MRLTSIILALVATAALAPRPAAAHTCYGDDVVCVAECFLHVSAHDCGLMDPRADFHRCPTSHSGVVLVVGTASLPACVPAVTVSPCNEDEAGVILYVAEEPRWFCLW